MPTTAQNPRPAPEAPPPAPAPGPGAPVDSPRLPLLGGGPLMVGMRYLLHKKLSYLAIVGVALAVGTLIVVMSVMTGFEKQLLGVIRGYHSDLTIQPRSGKLYGFADWRAVRLRVLERPEVAAVAPFIEGLAFVRFIGASTDRMFQAAFRGIDPELEPAVTRFGRDFMRQGRLEDLNKLWAGPNEARVRSCAVGTAMLGLRDARLAPPPGSLGIVLVTAKASLDKRLKPYRIAALFQTGRIDYDSQVVLLSLDSAMDLVQSDGAVSGLSVRLQAGQDAERLRTALQRELGPDYRVQTWRDKEPQFVEAVAMERFLMFLILSFIGLLAGFCIFAILTMTVAEKRRDIGVLKAIGFAARSIAAIFVVDGGAIGLFGALLGVAGGLAFTSHINAIADLVEELTGWTPFPPEVYYFTRIPVDHSPWPPVLMAAGAFALSLIFSAVPAIRAARLDPVQTLRYE